ncbi:NAD(P)H-dependent oxidoreductase [Pelagicoccus albus]|uniref:NAD(P)H-dependent oxidoreductase n=1 Tax=Pelagicoccus albus TaxID=415222 RepID=A0A7X1E8K1_9BACT|nr:NAD(P)H-dependent oxidoreductase [Pelagicoccus albus]MBC2606439.1 NAD(P)H-dependent oxidoreductase [Pelagicoccus albus]
MATIEAKDLLEQLNWRYATKVFDPAGKIPAETMKAIEESLVLTPSSFGLQPWKFLVVEDPELKSQLTPASWNQEQVRDCSHLVVFTAKVGYSREDVGDFIRRTAEVRGSTVESLAGYEQIAGGFIDRASESKIVDGWARNQVYIALGQLMMVAALLGVDACPMEGIQPDAYDKILGLEGTGYATVVACPLGYRGEGDKYGTLPKVRFPIEEMIERR